MVVQTRVIVDALRTVFTVFGASACFDTQQCAELHLIWVEKLSMSQLCFKDKIAERQLKKSLYFVFLPVVANWRSHELLGINRADSEHGNKRTAVRLIHQF